MRVVSFDYLDAHLREVPAFRALLRGIECRLFAEAGPLEAPVLDVGCGDGHFAAMAFGATLQSPLPLGEGDGEGHRQFVGFDLDEKTVKEAAGRGVYQQAMVASATAMPFADASFATVVSNCVVEHIPDLDATLAEIRRVLRPGGRFIFGVPSHNFGRFLLGSVILRRLGSADYDTAYGRWFNRHSRHFHTYAPSRWTSKLESQGFEIERWRYYMSPAGHRVFDLAHYLGIPALISRKLTGRWVCWHNPVTFALVSRWLHRYYLESDPEEGGYIFFECRSTPTICASASGPPTLPGNTT